MAGKRKKKKTGTSQSGKVTDGKMDSPKRKRDNSAALEKAHAARRAKSEEKKRNQEALEEKVYKSLNSTAKEINIRLEKAKVADDKAFDHRLSAAVRLDQAKQTCEDESVNFKKWCEENVSQSYETVRKLAKVGASDDPKQALEDMRSQNKAANKKLRDKKAASSDTNPKAKKASDFDQAVQSLDNLKDKDELNLIESRASKLGMQVVSESQLNELKSGGDSEIEDVKDLKEAFSSMKASEQLQFVKWAAKEIGMKLINPYTEDADEKGMPNMLKRKKAA